MEKKVIKKKKEKKRSSMDKHAIAFNKELDEALKKKK